MAKNLSLMNLYKDLGYVVHGIDVHAFLFNLVPPGDGKAVLELGCGSGKLGLAYALRGADSIMVDIDPEVIEYARRLRNALNSLVGFALPTGIRRGSLFSLKLPRGYFDLVFNEGVPQHWTEEAKRQGCIDIMARLSRDYVVVVGNNGLRRDEQVADRLSEFSYMGMPPKRKCFTPEELEMRLKKAGLKKVMVEPVGGGKIEEAILIGGWGRKT